MLSLWPSIQSYAHFHKDSTNSVYTGCILQIPHMTKWPMWRNTTQIQTIRISRIYHVMLVQLLFYVQCFRWTLLFHILRTCYMHRFSSGVTYIQNRQTFVAARNCADGANITILAPSSGTHQTSLQIAHLHVFLPYQIESRSKFCFSIVPVRARLCLVLRCKFWKIVISYSKL